MIVLYLIVLIVSFVILFKCADLFVTGATGLSEILGIPKMLVGIVFVGLGTTAPEFGVSVSAAFSGFSEMALGNAIGSVIADDGIALGLAALVAPAVIYVNCRILKIAGAFLLFIDFLAYFLARDGVLGRFEGILFLLLLVGYFYLLYRVRGLRSGLGVPSSYDSPSGSEDAVKCLRWSRLRRPILLFVVGIIGVVVASRFGVVWAAVHITELLRIPEIIIGSTVVALGTSLPEISTCITAARKGEGELAVGNIIGADVLNILWIIGVAALVRPIRVDVDIINFSFPFMILVVTVMLVSLRIGCRLTKMKGIILIVLYGAYILLTLLLFGRPPLH
ncbi:MAG: calcium/sodium antiporter [Acidobacteria bacterium]|nr:calcium/sodium antiporter [Acidobacteriota bacterium]